MHAKPDDKAPANRDEQFVVIKTSPFRTGDSFAVDFSKGDGKLDTLFVPYTAEDNPRYVIQFDEAAKANVLKRAQAPLSTHTRSRVVLWPAVSQVVHAVELLSAAGLEQSLPAARSFVPAGAAAVETLQNPRSTVGAKISALSAMLKSGITDKLLLQPNGVEPFAITLIDLERHSDPELA